MAMIASIQEGQTPQTAARGTGTATRETAPRTLPPARETVPGQEDRVLDPEVAEEFARQVQDTLSKVAPKPHEVAFRRDEATNGFVLEIRNADGTVVRQYPPEKLLNLRRQLDDLSGMVIDEMT